MQWDIPSLHLETNLHMSNCIYVASSSGFVEMLVSPAKRDQNEMGGLQKRGRFQCLSYDWTIYEQNWKTRWGDSINLLYCSHLINKSRRSYDTPLNLSFCGTTVFAQASLIKMLAFHSLAIPPQCHGPQSALKVKAMCTNAWQWQVHPGMLFMPVRTSAASIVTIVLDFFSYLFILEHQLTFGSLICSFAHLVALPSG